MQLGLWQEGGQYTVNIQCRPTAYAFSPNINNSIQLALFSLQWENHVITNEKRVEAGEWKTLWVEKGFQWETTSDTGCIALCTCSITIPHKRCVCLRIQTHTQITRNNLIPIFIPLQCSYMYTSILNSTDCYCHGKRSVRTDVGIKLLPVIWVCVCIPRHTHCSCSMVMA